MKLFKLLTLAAMSFGLAACGSQPAPAPTPVENKFPVKDVIAFYEAGGLDVVVPSYESKANEFEVDTEDPKAFVVYANSSSHDEMAAYKESLIKDSWVLISEVEGDYLLGYSETAARVSLVDFSEYVGIAFSIYEEAPEGMDPLAAATEIGSYWGRTPTLEEDGSYYVGGAFPSATYSVDAMKNYVTNLFVPVEFELAQDWTAGTFSDETPYEGSVYINSAMTVLEFYIYSMEVQSTPCTVLEVYAYTYSE